MSSSLPSDSKTPEVLKQDDTDSSMQLMDGDVQAIGVQCDMQTCRQLDFLPFKCGSCEGTYCLDHRSETAHACVHEGLWASRRRQNSISKPSTSTSKDSSRPLGGLPEQTCSAPECKTRIHTTKMVGVHCSQCRQNFCLPHRLPAQHSCQPRPTYQYAGGVSAQEKAKTALSRFKAWTSKSIPVTSKQSTAAQQFAQLAELKKNAKGEAKIATDKRIYLHVEAEAKTTSAKQPRGDYFYSKDWSVGKVMDMAAKSLQIPNLNNQTPSDENRLRVFHIEGGRLLTFGEKIGDSLVTGNTIVLLRGLQLTDMIED